MHYLKDTKNIPLSCGIIQLAGFPTAPSAAPKAVLEQILEDLRLCNGYKNKYVVKNGMYCYSRNQYVDWERESYSAAMIIVSLTTTQDAFFGPWLEEHGYKRIVEPVKNPNSSNHITVWLRMRPARNDYESRKKKAFKFIE